MLLCLILAAVVFDSGLGFVASTVGLSLGINFSTRFTSSLQSTWEEQIKRFDRNPTLTCELVKSAVLNVSELASSSTVYFFSAWLK